MKLYKLFMGITAAAMFAACSSDDLVAESPVAGPFDADGNAYVKIGITLPNVPTSRAIGEYGNGYGEFNDGEKYEYAVENAILVLFSGDSANEDDLELVSAYQLGSGAWNNDPTVEVTTNREFVQQISNAGASTKLYAYVILNKHSFFEVDNKQLKFTCGKGDHVETVLNGMTFGEFHALELKESGRRYDANSFLMTNMPYASLAGGATDPAGATIKNLYPVNAESIYPNETDAHNGSASTTINVERVLAKVETAWSYPAATTPLPGGGTADGSHFYTEDGNDYPVEILGWFIDNTNPNTYVARNCVAPGGVGLDYLGYKNSTAGTYRMVSGAAVTAGAYRTFWAVDNNYNVKAGEGGSDALINEGGTVVDTRLMEYNASGVNVGGRLRANNSYYYCTENTFDVEHQSEYNTTRVVVAARIGDGSNFYGFAQEPGVKYSNADVINYTKARIAERVCFMQWVADYCNGTVLDATQFIDVTVANPATAGRATVTIGETPTGFTSSMLKGGKTMADALAAYKRTVVGDTGLTGHNEFLANNYHVDFYKEGVAYYHALIKHFGDNETPWNLAAHAGVNNDVNGVYDGLDAAMYLGRYGVVRNNWYKVDISGVRKIGSATVPVLPGNEPDTPDDQVENFLKVKINITPWAIRKTVVKL